MAHCVKPAKSGKAKKGEAPCNPVKTLTNATRDTNRYVRAYALEGLKRMSSVSDDARAVVFKLLTASAWCPLTTDSSQF